MEGFKETIARAGALPKGVRKRDLQTLANIHTYVEKIPDSQIEADMGDQLDAFRSRGANDTQARTMMREKINSLMIFGWITNWYDRIAMRVGAKVGRMTVNLILVLVYVLGNQRRRLRGLELWKMGALGVLQSVSTLSLRVNKLESAPSPIPGAGPTLSAVTADATTDVPILEFIAESDGPHMRVFRLQGKTRTAGSTTMHSSKVALGYTLASGDTPTLIDLTETELIQQGTFGAKAVTTEASRKAVILNVKGVAATPMDWTVQELPTDLRPQPQIAPIYAPLSAGT